MAQKQFLAGRPMTRFFEEIARILALDTEDGVAGVEYAVIAGLVVGGLLVWWFR
jgi:Flp pilus assembly pilin Flp